MTALEYYMNTKLSLLAASIAVALSTGVAQAEGPIDGKIYGKVNLSLESIDEGTVRRVTQLKNNASRLGFKGKTAIENDMSVIYQLEYEANPDSGSHKGHTFTQRNSFVGIKGNFGTVFAGIHDTPTKKAQGKIDLFNDLEGDLKHVFNGENRAKNTVYYKAPKMGGLSADIAYVASEKPTVDDGVSAAGMYKQDNLYAAIGYDNNVEGEGIDTLRLVSQYKIDAFKLGAMWQQKKEKLVNNKDGFLVSAAYTMASNTFKLQYAASDIKAKGGTEASVGVDHKLAKKTKLFAFYTKINADAANSKKNYFGVGLEHKF